MLSIGGLVLEPNLLTKRSMSDVATVVNKEVVDLLHRTTEDEKKQETDIVHD